MSGLPVRLTESLTDRFPSSSVGPVRECVCRDIGGITLVGASRALQQSLTIPLFMQTSTSGLNQPGSSRVQTRSPTRFAIPRATAGTSAYARLGGHIVCGQQLA